MLFRSLPYGIANQTGPPSESELEKMLAIVAKHNLYGFDTAQSYGNSEARLGRLLGKKAARISTKLSPQLSHHTHMQTALANSLTQSLKNLNRKKIWMLMLHRFDWLADWSLGLGHFFETEKKANRIEQVGISVYNAKIGRAHV